jgi:hypothetical protein
MRRIVAARSGSIGTSTRVAPPAYHEALRREVDVLGRHRQRDRLEQRGLDVDRELAALPVRLLDDDRPGEARAPRRGERERARVRLARRGLLERAAHRLRVDGAHEVDLDAAQVGLHVHDELRLAGALERARHELDADRVVGPRGAAREDRGERRGEHGDAARARAARAQSRGARGERGAHGRRLGRRGDGVNPVTRPRGREAARRRAADQTCVLRVCFTLEVPFSITFEVSSSSCVKR